MGSMRKAVRFGDPTSNGGVVSNATGQLQHLGKIVATVGDLAFCPACHMSAPILQRNSVAFVLPNGKQIALEGDYVHCHCSPLPTCMAGADTTLVVEDNRAAPNSWGDNVLHSPRQAGLGGAQSSYDDFYKLVDHQTGEPLAFLNYAIKRPDGSIEYGQTGHDGATHVLSSSLESESVEIHIATGEEA